MRTTRAPAIGTAGLALAPATARSNATASGNGMERGGGAIAGIESGAGDGHGDMAGPDVAEGDAAVGGTMDGSGSHAEAMPPSVNVTMSISMRSIDAALRTARLSAPSAAPSPARGKGPHGVPLPYRTTTVTASPTARSPGDCSDWITGGSARYVPLLATRAR